MLQKDYEGYENLRDVEGRGKCGIFRFMFTYGLCLNVEPDGTYNGRYCYNERRDATEALERWNGEGDPDGEWNRFKSSTEQRSRLKDPFENNF